MRGVILFAFLISLASSVVGVAVNASDRRPKWPKCKKPVIRKEWRDMPKKEKKAFIDAVKCLGNKPGSDKFYATGWTGPIVPVLPRHKRSLYDDFVYSHMDTNGRTHFVGSFLYWHRMYLYAFENALRTECSYKYGLPYWDWTLDVADIKHSPIFDSDPVYGLGTWGTVATGGTVIDGAFRNVKRNYPAPHEVKRLYQEQPFSHNGIYPFDFDEPTLYANETVTPEKITAMIQGFKGDPFGFQVAIEGHRCQGLHSAMHFQFGVTQFGASLGEGTADGGDIANNSHAPNDPVFFLLHNNIDRIWQKWKDYDPANTYAIGGGTQKNITLYETNPQGLPPEVQVTDSLMTNGLAPNVTISDLLTTKGGYTCYEFQDPLNGGV
ncbi:hypothetical protein FRC03_004642 [Tulasnella sp. 419]|nr:hypothetical protein FRC02_009618 [Tulasnella sp. 418]KAG8962053.1 hypothetical protein FRC03_004642 [Tulasnella sp. 419]